MLPPSRVRSALGIAAIYVLAACGRPPSRPESPTGLDLDVVTTFPALTMAPPARQLDVVGRYLVVQGYASWVSSPAPPLEGWVFDATTGAAVSTFAPIGALNMEMTQSGPGVFLHPAGDVLVGMIGGDLFAVDPATGRRRWDASIYPAPASNRIWPVATASMPGTIVVLLEQVRPKASGAYGLDESLELIALDAASGTIRWRAAAGTSGVLDDTLGLFATDRTIVVRRKHDLVGYVEGKTAWSTTIAAANAPPPIVLGDRTGVVVADKNEITTIDLATGRFLAKHSTPIEYSASTIMDGGVLYGWRHADKAASLVATRASDGQRLWEASTARDHYPNLQRPLVARDSVLACVGGALRAFDRATGKATYTRNVGGCAHVGVSADPAPVVVVTIGSEGKPTSFARVASAPPPKRVRVTGTVSLECIPQASTHVWIDDAVVTTDAKGHFESEVTTRGLVRVDAEVRGKMIGTDGKSYDMSASDARDVAPSPDGTLRADFDLHLRTNCAGDYTPITCRPAATACAR